ncbi:MAG: site-2 protease family protein [Eubacteriales bacterium]|nr:site-2 protease family protein [Eubacteriales bacterium]
MPGFDLQYVLISILVLTVSLSTHEYAHARMAMALGDDTAEKSGRLTLNPLAHLELLGTLAFLLLRIGWAKPVPVNPSKLEKAKDAEHGMMLVSIAGPLSNLLVAFIAAFLYNLTRVLGYFLLQRPNINVDTTVFVLNIFVTIFLAFYYSNVSLAIFNLIPLPPLDGSKILAFFLPSKASYYMYKYQRYISFAMILLFIFAGSYIAKFMSMVSKPFYYVLMRPWEILANVIIN